MKTHYDVLRVDKTCSSKEIKDSYIKLSKQYHPDKNKNSDAHKKFIEVNEAYSILGKPDTRNKYDNSLSFEQRREHYRPGPSSTTAMRTPYEYYAHMYAKKNQETTGGYITIRKINLVVFCCILMMVGSGIQLKAELSRRRRISQEIARHLKETKERSKKMTKEQRIEEMESIMLKNAMERGGKFQK